MRRLGLLLALTALVVACTGGDDAEPTTAPDATTAPLETVSPDPAATVATEAADAADGDATEPAGEEPTAEPTVRTGLSAVDAYHVREAPDGPWVEPVTVELDEPTVAVARAAITAMLTPPPDEGLTTLAPEGTRLRGLNLVDGLLTVDLSGEVAEGSQGSAGEIAFQQQLAHTATQFRTVDEVLLWVDGAPVTELWGHLDWSAPFTADELALSPIILAEVAVDGLDVTVSGTANTFEATIDLLVTDADGAEVTRAFATATCGTGCRGDWSHTLTVPGPGTYVVTATEPDPSDGEGPPPFSVSRAVEVG